MKIVNIQAEVDEETCTGCGICEKVCPTLSIEVGDNRTAVVDSETCAGCRACSEECPVEAIIMKELDEPKIIKTNIQDLDHEEIEEICQKARFHPEQVICYCTGTRAEKVAGAIIRGADTPEKVSRATGVRTGCKTECIQPILRLLQAAGHEPEPRKEGWQWYGRTSTAWDLPRDLKEKAEMRKFHFDEDRKLLEKIVSPQGGEA